MLKAEYKKSAQIYLDPKHECLWKDSLECVYVKKKRRREKQKNMNNVCIN